MSAPHVLVIGGGLAGLQAAIACQDAGARVTLLEARSRLGGATWSRPNRQLGFEIDNGQHVFMRCCVAYRGLLDRLGVADRVVLQDRLAVPVARPGHSLVWIERGVLPAPAHLAASLLAYQPLALAARLRAGLSVRAISALDPDDPALDRRRLGDWLAERGESAEAIAKLWDVLVRPTLNIGARDASLALAVKVLRTGFLDTNDGADIGWSRVPLARLHAEPAARVLADGGTRVRCSAPVEGIEPGGSRRPAAWVRGERIEADAIVLAAPHRAAARLLSPFDPTGASALLALGVSPIVNLHAVFDRRVLDVPFVAGLDSELQWIFDRSEQRGLGRAQYLTVSLSDGEAYLGLSRAALQARFVPAFHALLPATRAAKLLRFGVTIEREATFRQSAGSREHRLRPGRRLPGVYLAGAWTDTGWPATMEGAVRSGRIAAEQVLRDVATATPAEAMEAA